MSDWRIDDLAQRAGVAVDTIRYYQREGLLQSGERNGRTRRYGPEHLEQLERIRALQSRRFSLAAIRALLDREDSGALVGLLSGDADATYDHDELVEATGVPAELVRDLTESGLLRDPAEHGRSAYDTDDVNVLRSFADLRRLAVPDAVLVEMARIYAEGLDAIQARVVEVFTDDPACNWDPGAARASTPRPPTRWAGSPATSASSPTTRSSGTCSAWCSRRSRRRAPGRRPPSGGRREPADGAQTSAGPLTSVVSADSSPGVPIAIKICPPLIRESGDGLVEKSPSGSRTASTRAPVRSRICASRERVPRDRRRGWHRDLLQAELDVTVVHHHVQELGHVRLQHERGHARTTDALRVDRAVHAAAAQLLDALVHAAHGPR